MHGSRPVCRIPARHAAICRASGQISGSSSARSGEQLRWVGIRCVCVTRCGRFAAQCCAASITRSTTLRFATGHTRFRRFFSTSARSRLTISGARSGSSVLPVRDRSPRHSMGTRYGSDDALRVHRRVRSIRAAASKTRRRSATRPRRACPSATAGEPCLATYSMTEYAQRDDAMYVVDRIARASEYEVNNDGRFGSLRAPSCSRHGYGDTAPHRPRTDVLRRRAIRRLAAGTTRRLRQRRFAANSSRSPMRT